MMEHYTTQATNAHNLWLQGLRELALKQARARYMAGETEKYKKPELYTAEVNRLWLQGLKELALRQVRARDMSRPEIPNLGKTLHGMWQHFVQGWELIFTPPPHQQDYPGTEAQQNPAEVAPEKEIDDSEFRAASVEVAENNQETWAPFKGSSEIKRSEEEHEKQETDAHSAAGTGEWGRSQLMKFGTEIRPEAPILRTELPRDDFVLPDKEFPSSGSEDKTEPEARAFMEKNQERDHYRESSIYQADAPTFIAQNEEKESFSIEQNDLSEAPTISHRTKQMENSFDDEDWHKETSETNVWIESKQSLIDDDGQPKEGLNKKQGCLSVGQNCQPEARVIKPLNEGRDHPFGDKKDPGRIRLGEGRKSFFSDNFRLKEEVRGKTPYATGRRYFINQYLALEAPVKSNLTKGIERLFGGEDRYSDGTRSKVPDQMVEGSFKRKDRCPQDDFSDTRHRLNKKRRSGAKRKMFCKEGKSMEAASSNLEARRRN